MSEPDFHHAAATLASLRADGLSVRTHFSGRVILAPDTRIQSHHRDIVRQAEPALAALLTLQQATSQAARGRAAR